MAEKKGCRMIKLPVSVSAPCRLDFGGTLDISTFYFPLNAWHPSTFNLAFNMRTTVTLRPYKPGLVRISSVGFEPVEYSSDAVAYNHPMGLMAAIASYFNADGVHIDIRSESPPRSALGGSSVAAVALIAAFVKSGIRGGEDAINPDEIVMLAHQIESSVARVPCGIQDQLAAAYGGVSQWIWTGKTTALPYQRRVLVAENEFEALESHITAAYCGQPHESKDINGKWVEGFLKGKTSDTWRRIVGLSNQFSDAITEGDFGTASALMRAETDIRLSMTPDVLDDVGHQLNSAAGKHRCGLRFTGAGGGGCVWALGEPDNIARLKKDWDQILQETDHGKRLHIRIDGEGLRDESPGD